DLIAGYIAAWQPSSGPPGAASVARAGAARGGAGAPARADAPLWGGGRAAGRVCRGAGAGLPGAALRAVRGTDIACRSGGVVVEVRGARPRAVPVLARYHQRLLAAAGFAGSGLVTGGASAVRKNITTPLTRSLAGGAGLPRLEASRLRMTWLSDCARLPARPPRSCTPPGSPAPSGWATCSPPSSPPMRQPRSRCWEPGGEHPAGPDQGDHRRFRRRAAARGAAAPLGG